MNIKVRNYLIELARQKVNQTVTYQKLSDDCGLNFNMRENPYDRKMLGEILGDISVYEFENYERPLLSALVLRAGDNYEGDGFYKLAENLGFGKWQKLKNDAVFEAIQIRECIKFWSNDKNYYDYK
ncbi:hypothetical protein [Flavobacterium sp. DSR2-3-3]|uniref:hypothetical protein n=1 Tax=Flavobacterium sp. DSR2-3-3 TaxID=2804632 RepID=UPI003CE83EEF